MAGQNFSVINNLASYDSQRNLGFSKLGINKSLSKISSGFRINNAGDDAAGLAIANSLKADSTALFQGLRNANDGIALTQIADGTLSQMDNMLNRAVQLATQAASGTVGDQEREIINIEYQEILKEIDRSVDATQFKGEKLLDPSGPVTKSIYVGDTQEQSYINVSIGGARGAGTGAMGLTGTDMLTAENAQSVLSQLKDAKAMASEWRGTLGAQQNRLQNSISIIQVQNQNIIAAESVIRDTNMAEELSNLTKNQILLQTGMASVAQSNATSSLILSLFGR